MKKFKLKFFPINKEVEIHPTESVLKVAQNNDIYIKSVCKGVPSCSECRVQIKEGEYNLIPPNEKEISLIGSAHFVDHSRLSCQLYCFGDVTIDLTEQIEKESRQLTSKRPRGSKEGFDEKESKAVMGTMILEEDNMISEKQEASKRSMKKNRKKGKKSYSSKKRWMGRRDFNE